MGSMFPFRFPFFPYCASVLTTLPTILRTTLLTILKGGCMAILEDFWKGGHMTILPVKLDKSVFIEIASALAAPNSLNQTGLFEFD